MVSPEIPEGSSVLGIGIDFIEVSRISRALERQGERFRNRVFTDQELAYCDALKFPSPHFAARFAAKEAVSKAFGTGIGEYMGWKTASVAKDELGKPYILLDPKGQDLLKTKGGTSVLVSLAHTKEHATAIAVLIR